MQHVLQLESANTSAYLSIPDDSGDMALAISDMEILESLNAEHLQQHEKMFRQASLMVADTNINEDALAFVAGTSRGGPLFVDTVSTAKAGRIRPHLGAVHTLTPSLIEAETLAGMKARTEKQLAGLANWFHDRGVKRLFVTMGEKGVFYSTPDEQGIERLDVGSHNMENAGGAGDAFTAGLAYAWLQDWQLLDSVRFALSAAGLTLSHAATNHPSLSVEAVQNFDKECHAG